MDYKIFMKKGFTLTEVLITLAIVGTIAALTIPSLVTKVDNEEKIAALKKSVTELSQVTNLIVSKNSGSVVGLISNDNSFLDNYAKYLLLTKQCRAGQDMGKCWHADGTVKDLQGKPLGLGVSADYDSWCTRAISADGRLYMFQLDSSNCTNNLYKINGTNVRCGAIWVDVNGFKKPNQVGRDIFTYILISTGKVMPEGADESSQDCDPNYDRSGWSGFGCANKIVKDGWKINY